MLYEVITLADHDAGKLTIRTESETKAIEPGYITLTTRDGEERIRCDRIIARIGLVRLAFSSTLTN